VQDAVGRALAGTAKCRQVITNGPEKIGEKAVVIPGVGPGLPISYGPDMIATPVHIFVDVTLDDQHAQNEGEIIRVMEVAAAQLGVLEDQEIIQGTPPPALGRGAPAPAAPRAGRLARNATLVRLAARAPVGGPAAI